MVSYLIPKQLSANLAFVLLSFAGLLIAMGTLPATLQYNSAEKLGGFEQTTIFASACNPNPGIFLVSAPLIACSASPPVFDNLQLIGNSAGAVWYVLLSNNIIQEYFQTNPTSTYPAGEYTVCGLVLASGTNINQLPAPQSTLAQLDASIANSTICAARTNNCRTLFIAQTPGLTISGGSTICVDQSANLNATVTNNSAPAINCQMTSVCQFPVQIQQVGEPLVNLFHIYRGFWSDMRLQMIYPAALLQDAGLDAGDIIKSLSYFVTVKTTNQPYSNFTIRMSCTSLNTAPTTFEENLPIVYQQNYSTNLGWNTHLLNQGLPWDGTSNLLIQICYDNTGSLGGDDLVAGFNTGNNVVFSRYGTDASLSGCAMTTQGAPNTFTQLPVMQVGYCPPAGSIEWSPAATLSCDDCFNPVANPTQTTTYTATLNPGLGCLEVSQNVTVTVQPYNTIPMGNTIVCSDNPVFMGNQVAGDTTLLIPISCNTIHSYNISFQESPSASISGNYSACAGSTFFLPVATAGQFPLTIGYTLNGQQQTAIYENPPVVIEIEPTTFPINITLSSIISDNGCAGTVQGSVNLSANTSSLNVPGGTALCPGQSRTMNLSGTGIHSVSWSPPTGLSSSTSQNPVATPAQTTTYTATINHAGGTNMIYNSNFQFGNTGFTTDYAFLSSGVAAQGKYAIGPGGQALNPSWPVCNQPGGGGGNMFSASAAFGNAGKNVWCQEILVAPNRLYHIGFSGSMATTPPAELRMQVNGANAGPLITLQNQVCAWNTYAFTWNSGANNGIVNFCIVGADGLANLGAGFHLDNIFFIPFCTTEQSVTLTVDQFEASITSSGSSVLCQGASVNLTGQPAGMSQYQWTSPQGNLTGQTITASQTGTYTLNVTSPAGCVTTSSFALTVNPPATPQLTSPGTVCANAAPISMNPFLDPNFTSGSWTGPGMINPTTFAPSTAGVGPHMLTFISNAACTNPASIIITVLQPVSTVLSNANVCSNNTSFNLNTLKANPGLAGVWSGPGTNALTGNFNASGLSGTVTVTFTPNGSCTNQSTAQITIVPVVTPSISSQNFCSASPPFNLNSIINAQFQPGTWSGTGVSGGNTFNPGVVGSGSVTLTFQSSIPCVLAATVVVNVSSSGPVNLGTATICANHGSFNLATLQDPQFPNGTWTGTGVSSNLFNPPFAGTFNMTFTPSGSCAPPAMTQIVVQPNVTPQLTFDTICQHSGLYNLNSLVQSAITSGTWTGQQVNGTNFNPAGLSGNISLNFLSSQNCALPANTYIYVLPTQQAILQTDTVCVLQNTYDLSNLLDPQYPTGSWSGNFISTDEFQVQLAGVGNFELTFTPDVPCALSTTTTLVVRNPDQPVLQQAVICADVDSFNLNTLLDPEFPIGSWSGPGVFGDSFFIASFYPGQTVNILFAPVDDCTVPAETSLAIVNIPAPQIQGSATFCIGGSTTLSASGFETYLWMPGGVPSSTFNVNQPGWYYLEVSDINGCVGYDSIFVTSDVGLNPQIIDPGIFCAGDTAILQAGTYFQYLWSDGSVNATLAVTMPGTYSVTVQDADGCTGSDTIEIVLAGIPYDTILNYSVCPGTVVHDVVIFSDTTIVRSLQSQAGCDSLVTDIISVWEIADTTWIYNFTCDDTEIGVFPTILSDQNNCDSVIVTIIEKFPPDTVYVFEQSCQPADTGTVVLELETAAGCDSIVITFTSLEPYTDFTFLAATSCDSSQLGIDTLYLFNFDGCDSLVITTTDFVDKDSVFQYFESCQPQNAGIEVDSLQNAFGCDSLVFNVTTYVPQADSVFLTQEVCDELLTGLDTIVFLNQEGCDSVVVTLYFIPEPDTTLLFEFSCQPIDTGIFVSVLFNQDGCDSIIILDIALEPYADTTFLEAVSCDIADAGLDTIVLLNQDGCDSLIITETLFYPADSIYITDFSCFPADTGLFVTELLNQWNCDSLIFTQINLLPTDTVNFLSQSCNPLDVGTIVQVFTNQWGCDSVIIDVVEFDPAGIDTIEIALSLCYGEIWNGVPWFETSTVINEDLNQAGCDSFTVYQIEVFDEVIPDITGESSICQGTETTISVNEVFSSYLWSTGANGNEITVSTSGTYQVTVTDVNGCTGIAAFELTAEPAMNLVLQAVNSSCQANGGQAIALVFGGTAPYTFNWSTGATTSFISGLASGSYSVTVTDAAGCTAEQSTLVMSVGNGPQAELISSDISCYGDEDGSLQLVIQGGSEPMNIQWGHSNGNELQWENLPAGIYEVTVTDVNGCIAYSTAEIFSPSPLFVEVQVQPPGTGQQNGSATAWVSGGTPPYQYAWSTGGSQASIHQLGAGMYTVTVTDANGCSSSLEFQVGPFTDIREVAQSIRFEVFPNPFSETLQVAYSVPKNAIKEKSTIELYNSLGQLLKTKSIKTDEGVETLETHELPAGAYYLGLRLGEKVIFKQIVKQ